VKTFVINHSAAFPSLSARFNRWNADWESFSGKHRGGGASSSGIQSHSVLEVSQDKYPYLISVISSSMFDFCLVHVLIVSLLHCVESVLKKFRAEIDSKSLF